jgi:hypothetical protein
MILSSFANTQVGRNFGPSTDVRHRVASRIARAALDEAQLVDRLWASVTQATGRPHRSHRHKQFVAECLAFFFSVAEGFLKQSLRHVSDIFLEDLAETTCLHALADPSVPTPYLYASEGPRTRYMAYKHAIMMRRVELWHVYPYATVGALADMSVEQLTTTARMPTEGHIAIILRERLEWAATELVGRL